MRQLPLLKNCFRYLEHAIKGVNIFCATAVFLQQTYEKLNKQNIANGSV